MDALIAAALAAVSVAYNNALNRWPRFNGPMYVPLNLAFATASTLLAAATLSLSRRDLGLTGELSDLVLGFALGAILVAPAFVIAQSRYARLVADRRVAQLRGSALAYQVLVRIPLGTALAEELLFRGVLYAAWRAAGLATIAAAMVAAGLFGLWHISPTVALVRANDPSATLRSTFVVVAGAVVFTTIAGLTLTWLRVVTPGLGAPIGLHAATNSLGTLAAVLAARRAASSF